MRGITILFDTDRNTHPCDQALEFSELCDLNFRKIPSGKVREYFPGDFPATIGGHSPVSGKNN
jgi:hypothetical protein